MSNLDKTIYDKPAGRVLGLISKIYRRKVSITNYRLEKIGVSSGTYVYFLIIDRFPGITQKEVSYYLANNKATTAKNIKNLIQDGYIYRTQDSKDKRVLHLYLTKKGLHKLEEISEKIREFRDEVFLKETADVNFEVLEKELTKIFHSFDTIYNELFKL